VKSSASFAPVFDAGFVGPVDLYGFDAVEQVSPAWDHAHSQLGRGDARVRVTVAHTRRMELAVVSRSPGVLIRGSPPRGMAVLGICLAGPTLHLQRMSWGWDRVGVLPRDVEFEIISTTPHTIFELCVDADRLQEEAAARWGPRFDVSASAPYLRFRDGASRERLVATWGRYLASARSQPEALTDAGFAERLEDEALDAVLDGVEPERPASPPKCRRDVALRAEAFLRQSLDEPIRIEDVCVAARASRQTLHASFRSVFGTSPMAYSRSLRLSAARRDLERASRGTTVATVAMKWGFFRLGHFSVDYREMFGEKPSETLHRARGTVPPPDGTSRASPP
jgi:AraC family ethanolamine operon transcriptional activator